MKCPACDQHSDVIDSRAAADYVYRRRRCPACGYRFTTHEYVVPEGAEENAPPEVRVFVGRSRVY